MVEGKYVVMKVSKTRDGAKGPQAANVRRIG